MPTPRTPSTSISPSTGANWSPAIPARWTTRGWSPTCRIPTKRGRVSSRRRDTLQSAHVRSPGFRAASSRLLHLLPALPGSAGDRSPHPAAPALLGAVERGLYGVRQLSGWDLFHRAGDADQFHGARLHNREFLERL